MFQQKPSCRHRKTSLATLRVLLQVHLWTVKPGTLFPTPSIFFLTPGVFLTPEAIFLTPEVTFLTPHIRFWPLGGGNFTPPVGNPVC